MYKQLHAQAPVPPPAAVTPTVALPPPPAAPSQTPAPAPLGSSTGPGYTPGINMDSFLAGVNFSRTLSAPQAPQFLAPQHYMAQPFAPPPPPPPAAPRLTLEDIISLVRAGQPSFPGPGYPSAHSYHQYPGYYGSRF